MISTVLPLHSLKTRVALTTLTIVLLSLWSLSFYASQMLRHDMEHLLGEQQFSTVSYVAAEISHEVDDRMSALKVVASTISPATMTNPAAMQTFLEEHPALQHLFNGGVIACRLDGAAIADSSLSAGRIGVNYIDIDTVAAALKEGQSTIGRPVMGKKLWAPVFGMTVPIRDPKGNVIGALSGVTNLGQPGFVDIITESRYSKTGGYLLVAPQYRLVVTATDKGRAMETLPASGINPMLDRFMQGYEGPGVANNPQGVEVLASAKGVPVAGWYVAAELPAAEAFAPIHIMQQRMLLATILLTLLAGALTWWLLRRQLAPLLAAATALSTRSETNQPAQPLPITRQDEIGQLIGGFNCLLETLAQREGDLRESEGRYRSLVERSPEAIAVHRNGEIIYANPAALQLFGAQSAQDLVGKPILDRIHPDFHPIVLARVKGIADHGVIPPLIEERCLNLDGSAIDLEVQCTPIVYDGAPAIHVTMRDITARRQAEEALRIAAIAFECQEGMIVTDVSGVILRTNQSFTRIMGYTDEEVIGRTTAFMQSDRHPPVFYDTAWDNARRDGAWHAEVWHKRKNGEVFAQWLTSTAVKDQHGDITHFVVTHSDITSQKQREEKRLADEAAHRDTLVREVHHRIKNNLQGITGLLRQFSQKHPETAAPINQAIGQVQGISVIHGLQGRAVTSTVRLCELTTAIANEIQNLWQTPVTLDIPPMWLPCIVAEKEAVPIALMLNELIVNAVKHGGKAHGKVSIALQKGPALDMVQISISNAGQLPTDAGQTSTPHRGLQLIAALMPPHGARLAREQRGAQVITLLELAPPVISLEVKESK